LAEKFAFYFNNEAKTKCVCLVIKLFDLICKPIEIIEMPSGHSIIERVLFAIYSKQIIYSNCTNVQGATRENFNNANGYEKLNHFSHTHLKFTVYFARYQLLILI